MLSCSTECPNCKHAFQCCPSQKCAAIDARRSLQSLTGGGLVTTPQFLAASPPCQQQLQPFRSSPCASPQASPSVPLVFVMPTTPHPMPMYPNTLPQTAPESDLKRLAAAVRHLKISGWYFEGVSYDRGHELLKSAPVGSFLVRNSSDPRFLFSLSVRTERGPMSVRLHYADGYFRLDAQPHLQHVMPRFVGVVELVQHYVEQNRFCKENPQVWVDSVGKWFSPILLESPLRPEPPTLKHLSRLSVHRALQNSTLPRLTALPAPHTRLKLPLVLKDYLSEYPFSL